MKEKEAIEVIKNCEKLFVIFSRITHKAYIEKDELDGKIRAHMYVSQERAEEHAKKMAEEQIPAVAVVCQKNEKLQMFNDVYLTGVEEVIFHLEETFYIELQKIIRKPDYSHIPEPQRPIENQLLQSTLCRYMQVARNAATAGSDEVKKLDKEVVDLLPSSKFVIGYKKSEEVNEQGQPKLHLLLMKNEKLGVNFVPIFTDNGEFNRFAKGDGFVGAVIDLPHLSQFKMPEGIDTFCVNPNTCNLPLPQELLAKMLYNVTWAV